MSKVIDLSSFVGRSIEQFSPAEWRKLHGLWAALEIYTQSTVPLRFVAAVGASVEACVDALQRDGFDPRTYEFVPLRSPLPL